MAAALPNLKIVIDHCLYLSAKAENYNIESTLVESGYYTADQLK